MLPNLSNHEFEALTQGARILEKDGFGLKVLRLPDARILKLFRRRHWLSSQLWAPHAQRFDRNAKDLLKRGIPTLSVEQIFYLPEMQRQAVLYHELPGTTLRQWLREHEGDEATAVIQQFGRFVTIRPLRSKTPCRGHLISLAAFRQRAGHARTRSRTDRHRRYQLPPQRRAHHITAHPQLRPHRALHRRPHTLHSNWRAYFY